MPVTTSCPIQTAVEMMGGKWKPGILSRLKGRTLRFGELRREMPWINERVLARQLKELVGDELVSRTDHREKPLRVDYTLSDYGETLVPVLEGMCRWGEAHLERARGKAPPAHRSGESPARSGA